MTWNYLTLITVGFLWGATNPFLRSGSKGVNKIQTNSRVKRILLELRFVFTQWRYVLPFLLNQSGSVLYVFVLQKTALSTAVPVANSLSFVFSAIVASLLGEAKLTKNVLIGTGLVIVGNILCVLNSAMSES